MKEYEVYEFLKSYGIKTPQYKIFDIDKKLFFNKFPAVLKILSKKVVHKSDVGGIRVGIDSNEELQQARNEMVLSLQKNGIFLDSEDKFIVQETVRGEEFYIGGVYDDIFEEVLLFGKGGTLIEIEKDVCYIDTASEESEILKSFNTTKISKIFPNFRGKEYKIEYVLEVIKKFQKLFLKEDITEFDINPLIYTDNGFIAVDARMRFGKPDKKRKKVRKYDIFQNKKIAIFGATDKKEKVGYAIAKNSLKSSCDIYFVNPRLKSLFDKKVYTSVEELPNIDTAIIAIPSHLVLELVMKLAKKRVQNIIIISAGFKESGNKELEEKIKKVADDFGLNVIGPNCLGIYDASKNLNLTFATDNILAGDIALISQSGAVLSALLDKAYSHSIGFSHILSLGNMVDFDFTDAVRNLQNKNECKFINIYAEGLQDGKEFLKAIRESKKTVFIYKTGKSAEAKRAAFSHTGNISGDYEMLKSLCYAAGAVIKDDIEELVFSPKFQNFDEVLIITNAGGPGTILTDIVTQSGKKLYNLKKHEIEMLNKVLPDTWSKNNPVDIIGDATSDRYQKTLEILYNEKLLIFVVVTPQYMTDSLNIAKIVAGYKNIVPVFFGEENFKDVFEYFKKDGILYFNDLENIKNIL
ncbi:acetate--CoA ligase family protein [Nitrosophilus labii]|uniref:acetate--CoA ligase family protein n=1 Tax=Nitrosophilus labii TaxID=2706014 RepID=UPI0016569DB4|nr:acetate--CoA ligase family protein [Nitrosophilus labii]